MINFTNIAKRFSIASFPFVNKQCYINRINYAFSTNKNGQEVNKQNVNDESTKKQQFQFSPQEEKQIKEYETDKIWNMFMDLDPNHNLQKDLIVHRKQYDRSTKELRASILFEDLLKTEIDIPIYDTKGKPYLLQVLKLMYIYFSIAASIWTLYKFATMDPKNKVLLERTTQGKIAKYSIYALSTILFITTIYRYARFQKRFVERIVYNTQREQFSITKRKFIGLRKQIILSRFKLMYTQNPFLNNKGTNYFDIDNKEEFMIVYKDAWIKQDLFSHLISQRIKI